MSAAQLSLLLEDLDSRLTSMDKNAVKVSCGNLITYLLQHDTDMPPAKAEEILQRLRNVRMFRQMSVLADAFIQTGRGTYKIWRQYAQALIDTDNYTASIAVLKQMAADTAAAAATDEVAAMEYAEAQGLLGKVYKQLYVKADNPANPASVGYITSAVDIYYTAYTSDNNNLWHGINAVALLERARRDRVSIPNAPDARVMAQQILTKIERRYAVEKADAWDFATAAEACIALNKPDEALKWMSGYVRMPYCSAFALASTLRQLEELWQLHLGVAMGRLILPLLRAELLNRNGGDVLLNIAELRNQQALDNSISIKYKSLIVADENRNVNMDLEKVFGTDSFQSYRWYMTGAERCMAVARIGTDVTKGYGSGFLLKGNTFHESWGDQLLLITNAHVIGDESKALRVEEAIVTFEALDQHSIFRDLVIVWSSPSAELDATILRFSEADEARLQALTKSLQLYPASRYLPVVEDPPTQNIYIIGHPNGGTLQLSLQDNLLIDHEAPRIHYRIPTDGGSSGSPVFNRQWELIGLHHAGSKETPCLNGKQGVYEANEGIWIQSIKAAVNEALFKV